MRVIFDLNVNEFDGFRKYVVYVNTEYLLCGSFSSLAVGELVVGAGVVDVVSKDMSKQLQIAEVWNQISLKHQITSIKIYISYMQHIRVTYRTLKLDAIKLVTCGFTTSVCKCNLC